MKSFFRGATSVSFAQIGAYDGNAGDPIRQLILDSAKWKGILVEPQTAAFEKLRQNYAGRDSRLMFVNCAISDASGEKTLYSIPEGEIARNNLPDWAREIASFDEAHVRKHFPQARTQSSSVKVSTFRDLADSLRVERVDLVVIDVEGHEFAILSNIDFDMFGVSFIVYEHKHMASSEKASVTEMLSRRGFKLKTFGRDTIAWRRLA